MGEGMGMGEGKIVALVRTSLPEADREAICAEIEANAQAADRTGLTGLILSRVDTAFAEGDPLVAMIEAWGEGIDVDALIAGLVPDRTRQHASLEVTVATCEELIFKRVPDYARPGSPWGIKLAGTAFRRDDFTPDAFFEYWTNTHAPIGGSVPGVGGYTVSRVRGGRIGSEQADAIIEQWYPSAQAFSDAQSTEPAKAAWNDVGNYAKTTGTAFWLMTESVIVEPPLTGPGTLES